MNLVKICPYEAGVTVATDKHGYEYVLAVAKGTFEILPDGACQRAQEQQPLAYADIFNGETGLSSVRYECDFALHKPMTDVIVNGTAHAPGGHPVAHLPVHLEVGSVIKKAIAVFGDRVWEQSSLDAYSPSQPKPFSSMPLVYERSFGGWDTSNKDPLKHGVERRNLVGVGFNVKYHEAIKGTPLPNLENLSELIQKPTDAPKPAGFGFVPRNWLPRCNYAGTYDRKWQDEHYPFLPPDFDDRHYQAAPEDQMCPYLQGGERIRISNVTKDGKALEFILPTENIPVIARYKDHHKECATVLDTVVIDSDERRLMLVWRASMRISGKLSRLQEVMIGMTPGRRLALDKGKRYIGRADRS